MNVASTVLTRQIFMTHKGRQTIEKLSSQKKKCPTPWFRLELIKGKKHRPLCGHVFQPTGTVFILIKDIIGINLLTKFHEDLTINVASRVKNAPQLVAMTNISTKFHNDLKIIVAPRVLSRKNTPHPPSDDHIFQPTGIIF
ncbi:hypothetical protein DPMN_148301 [Dreissena polymorpha]|uniref:Uncharacterized protein n=1 Tax=Dreissena polymorpha TaxID=45954 RepID=A0A9D4J3U9_DREPO|nr:hypothetical protein DPMN_148301 [Dreissena polymorpha]